MALIGVTYYSSNTMTQYLSRPSGRDTSVLQSRTCFLFWKDLAYGSTHSMTVLAMRMERERLICPTERSLFERRISKFVAINLNKL